MSNHPEIVELTLAEAKMKIQQLVAENESLRLQLQAKTDELDVKNTSNNAASNGVVGEDGKNADEKQLRHLLHQVHIEIDLYSDPSHPVTLQNRKPVDLWVYDMGDRFRRICERIEHMKTSVQMVSAETKEKTDKILAQIAKYAEASSWETPSTDDLPSPVSVIGTLPFQKSLKDLSEANSMTLAHMWFNIQKGYFDQDRHNYLVESTTQLYSGVLEQCKPILRSAMSHVRHNLTTFEETKTVFKLYRMFVMVDDCVQS